MTKSAFKEILERYIAGTTTPAETAFIQKWYDQVDEIDKYGSPKELEKLGDEIYENIQKHIIESKGKTATIIKWSLSVAAALVFILGAASLFYYQNSKREDKTISAIVPGTDKAILKLADGTEIQLDAKSIGDLANEGGANITKSDSTTLSYTASNNEDPVKYNEVHIPTGGKFSLKLPDGTTVWLNSVSSIKFPTRFKGTERKVFITGEAYFEVARNEKMPFIVEVQGKQKIEVLGTHFNISAYSDENVVRTTLVEGSVKISSFSSPNSVVLKPGQQAAVARGKNIETNNNINIGDILAWKDGYFSFNKTDISEIGKQLSRWYGVEIYIDEGVMHQTFSGKLPRTGDIYKVLQLFEITNTVTCKVSGNQIKIYRKN